MRIAFLLFALAVVSACSSPANTAKPTNAANASSSAPAKSGPLPVYGYEVVKSYPHDPKAFTQGLFFRDGFLYESTGEEGASSIRKVELATGKVVQKWDLPRENFGEGSTELGGKIYMVTWQDQIGRVFDAKTFQLIREFSYQGEGWGLTNDGTNLWLSQGTHVLKVIDPTTFNTVKTVPVMREDGRPLMQLNELEWVNGEIWANVWHSEKPNILGKPNYIARIDPATGKLTGWIDLAGISPDDQPKPRSAAEKSDDEDPFDFDPKEENTLNGIAYDAATERIFVTGKNWKKLYEIKLTGPKNQ